MIVLDVSELYRIRISDDEYQSLKESLGHEPSDEDLYMEFWVPLEETDRFFLGTSYEVERDI